MNKIVYVLLGVVYLIYCILCRDKVTYFIREYSRTSEMTVIRPREFFRLQLKFSIFNSLYLIIYGISLYIFNLDKVFFIVGFLPFPFINLLLIMKSKTKGYVDYKIGKTYK
ncbi:hypothetical protein LGK95_03910 [Clostridium algoriphilum]|uniref:hypothetical protein n=1 Tax=Clostridium algoriphilum TaxID=198347 RepID=UPI001CF10217|nr:hypothetical protein [Clostridium algoriphilum]MCB2292682.1 hypothetical protein [Clostridium algoriphilum]